MLRVGVFERVKRVGGWFLIEVALGLMILWKMVGKCLFLCDYFLVSTNVYQVIMLVSLF